ncbi:MAG: efflux RND transporter permease subunit, partial [Bacteriovoracaceae bacterium]|nr:efflux RND transporter permease subunit [Bacteriovoracaceae bacterium]
MKGLLKRFVENSILVNFITVFIIVVGGMATFQIQKELRPAVSIDKVYVSTYYQGASPEEVERLVTIPIEEEISAVSGVANIESVSAPGFSTIIAEIDTDAANKYEVVQEIFRAVTNVKNLPDDAENPVTREIKAAIFPIFGLALYGDASERELRHWARILQDRLELVEGVNSADISGVREPTIDVVVNPKKLQLKSISVSEVMTGLSTWNKSAPAGYLRIGSKEIPVRIDESFDKIERVSKVILRTNDMGEMVRVRDIAKVDWGFKTARKLGRYNGKNNVQITVSKDVKGDTIDTVDNIKREVARFKDKLPHNIKTVVYRNDAPKIQSKLSSVSQNAWVGLILVVVVLLLMLNWRIALVTAIGLPVAFFGAIWALKLMGHTLNTMTLIGIILVVGMLVDDGIVVAENIFHHYEKGKGKRQAALDGVLEIFAPIVGTIVTTIVAFLPLAFMSGVIGNFIAVIPVAVITCLVFSLFECLFILPNHAAEFMNHSKSRVSEYLNNLLENLYRPALHFVVRRRWVVAPLIFLGIILLCGYHVKTFKMKMFPTKGITKFSFNIEGPANTHLDVTDSIMKKIESKVDILVGKRIDAYETAVGSMLGRYRMSQSGTHVGGIRIYLLDEQVLDVNPKLIVKEIRKSINPLIPEGWKLSFEIGRHGPPSGKSVELEIGHHDFDVLDTVSRKIQAKLKSIKGSSDVQDDLLRGYTQMVLKIDAEAASILGVSPSSIQRVSMSAFEGVAATKVRKIDDEYDVLVLYPNEYRQDQSKMMDLKLKSKYGTYVPLRNVAKIVEGPTLGAIKHYNEKRTVVVSSGVRGKNITAQEINRELKNFVANEISPNYPDVLFNFGGEEKERRESLMELLQMFLIALLGIYMILSLVFSSPFYPFFVLLIIPFGFAGAMTALGFHGEVMSFPGMIALVGLTGIVVNDAIILVNYIRDRFKEHKNILEAVVEGGMRRVR